jgi:FtsP/CotA-like multicopper oxidase with cupredoxin domain
MLGHGEPIRVREGQRILFRLLNASPTENVTLALPGHRFTVIALDGNPVPSRPAIDTLFLAPVERADVIVEMNRPGIWIFGAIRDEDRKLGLGVVIEYANQRGEPQWATPPNSVWDYTIFGVERPVPAPDERLALLFEKVPGGRGGYNRWTINGKSWPNTNPLFTTQTGKRYRLAMTNKSGDNHPVHLHRHHGVTAGGGGRGRQAQAALSAARGRGDESGRCAQGLAQQPQGRRDRAKAALETAKSHIAPQIRIDPALIERFGRSMREKFTTGSVPFRKAYLQSLVDVIEVDDHRIRIKGLSAPSLPYKLPVSLVRR